MDRKKLVIKLSMFLLLITVLAVGIASAALGGLASAVSRAVGIRPESKGELFLKPIEA